MGIALAAKSGSGHANSASAACATITQELTSSAALGHQHPQVTSQQHEVTRAHLYLVLHSRPAA